jgi:hypothetical protein
LKASFHLRCAVLISACVGFVPPAMAADMSNAPLPEITSESEDGFVDLVLGIHSVAKEGGGYRITARGTNRGTRVGFEVVVGPDWKGEDFGTHKAFVGRITFRSLGAESDAFVHALAQLYKLEGAKAAMKGEVAFEVVSLEGDPRALEKGKVSTKLFYESADEKRYAEAYANFDLAARKFYFREKDNEYRHNLLQALSR